MDLAASAARIGAEVETLGVPPFSDRAGVVDRRAFTPAYAATVGHLGAALEDAGLAVGFDPVGNLIARNRPAGEPAYALGSHCDSNPNGGRFDGALGVIAAIEVCRLARERDLDLPLQVISFVEEEGSGFGTGLIGSRVMSEAIGEAELAAARSPLDGRGFLDHAAEAGYAAQDWRQSRRQLDGVLAWFELHIEQARRLERAGVPLAVVEAIAGRIEARLIARGRTDHAGATPMDERADAAALASFCVLELERLALARGDDTVATVGRIELSPGSSSAIAGEAICSLDLRAATDEGVRDLYAEFGRFAHAAAARRGLELQLVETSAEPATTLDRGLARELERSASALGARTLRLRSGAVHDTMFVARVVPAALLFVPCRDGISHDPAEQASPADAALAVEVILATLVRLERERLGGAG